MTGAEPTQPAARPEDLFAEALPDWPAALDAWGKERLQYAWWEVNLLPVPSLARPLEAQGMIELIRTSAVRWRGWYYPTYGVRDQDFPYKQNYARFIYDDEHHSERWQASYAGAFSSAHIVRGDMIPQDVNFRHPPAPDRLIDRIDIVWSVTEFFRFATSLAEGLGCEALWVRIALHNVERRLLGAFDPSYGSWGFGTSSMPDVVQGHVFARTELASAWREFALDWTKRILTVFQWPDANRDALAALQTRLFERRW